MIKRLLSIITVLLLVFPLAAAQEYRHAGYDGYAHERGNFDGDVVTLDDIIVTTRGVTNTKYIPLFDDLDGDSTQEIIIIADDDLRIFSGSGLTVEGLFDFGSEEDIGNMIIFDIDGDSTNEIIVPFEDTERIIVFSFNGSDIINESQIELSGLSDLQAGSELMINCRDTNECLIAWQRGLNSIASAGQALGYVEVFNSTSVAGTGVSLQTSASAVNQQLCFPKIKNIEVADLKTDGDKEYIIGYNHVFGDGNAGDTYYTEAWTVTAGVPTQVWVDSVIIGNDVLNDIDATNCGDNWGSFMTSPLTFDIDASTPTQQETAFGYMISDDNYRIRVLNADGIFLAQYPLIDSGAGVIISNSFRANSFPESDNTRLNEVCVIGFDTANNEQTMICGGEDHSKFFSNYEYTFDLSSVNPQFNVTQDYQNWNVIAHSAQHDTTTTELVDLTEVVTSYGVFAADFDTCDIIGNCRMALLFQNPIGDSVLVSVDGDNIGTADLCALSDTQLSYIDDSLSNQPARITTVRYNPCPDDTIKINTTLEVTLTVTDGSQGSIPADLVNHNVKVYVGLANEQESPDVLNVTSGVPQNHVFQMNQTVSNGKIEVRGFDNGVPGTVDLRERFFNVGTNGLVFGESQCTDIFVEDIETFLLNETAFDGTSTTQNVITTSAQGVGALFGLGAGITYLLVMLIIMGGIVWQGASTGNAVFGLYGALVVGTGMLVLGSILNLIPIAIIIITVVIAVAIVAIAISRVTLGDN